MPPRLTGTCALVIVACLTGPAEAAELHVAPPPRGADTHPGTAAAPFGTIQRAATVAGPGDTVLIHAGIYRETVVPARSGTSTAPITFRGAQGERASVRGTDVIPGPWTRALGGRGLSTEVPLFPSAINQAPQVFVDGKMLVLARWPDTPGEALSRPVQATVDACPGAPPVGERPVGSCSKRKLTEGPHAGKTEWVFEDAALPRDRRWVGAQIYLQPNAEGWSWVTTGLVTAHEGQRLTMVTWNDAGDDARRGVLAVGARYHLFDTAEALDVPGEWHHQDGRLTVIPPEGDELAGRTVEVKRRDFAFDLSGRSHIRIENLEIFGATITTDRLSSDGRGGGQPCCAWRKQPSPDSHHVVIDRVTALYVSHFTDLSGHMMGQWSQNTGLVLSGADGQVSNSVIRWSAGNGIAALGPRHRVFNNLVEDTNYAAVEAACLSTGWETDSPDQEWFHNTCRRTGRSGLQIRTFFNADPRRRVARIHHNDVVDYALQDFDAGAFYTYGRNGQYARIDHNWFHLAEPREGLIMGAYWDFSAGYVLDHNVIWGMGFPIQITGDYDGTGRGNFIIHNNTAQAHGAWGRPYRAASARGTVVRHNILGVHTFSTPDGKRVNHWPDYGAARVVADNLVWGGDPDAVNPKGAARTLNPGDRWAERAGFVDPARFDFQLAAGSPAVDAVELPRSEAMEAIPGRAPTPAFAVPLFSDALVGRGDLGAYERGVPPWTAGAPMQDIGADGTPAAEPDGGCACRLARRGGEPDGAAWLLFAAAVAARRRLMRRSGVL